MDNASTRRKLTATWKQIRISLVLVLLAFVFISKVTELLTDVLVKPLMQSVETSNLFIDIVTLASGLAIIVFFIFAARQSLRIGLRSAGYIVLVAVLYCYYRIPERSAFEFTGFYMGWLKWFVLSDILVCPFIGLLLYYLFKRWVSKQIFSAGGQRGFYTDTPVILDTSNDVFKRSTQITELKNRLLATATTERSFAISINGKWGAGKSTFIRTLRRQLEAEPGVITMDFNPWMATGDQAITQIFFNDLSARLSAFDRSLETEITDYSKELLSTFDNSTIKFLRSLVTPPKRSEQLQDRYNKINRRIGELDKKIVVFVDDIDRLGTAEIMDVLRIIRNTADFGNIYFIAAFDKVYVVAQMAVEISTGAVQYLEKIFQLEYYLSLHSRKGIFVEDVIGKLKPEIIPAHRELLDKILQNDTDFFVSEIKPPLEDYLLSFRDVNRFMNVFVTNYSRIAANIYFPDYLSICLLRLKYPEVYRYLYYNKYDFLMGENASDLFGLSIRGYESGRLELRYDSGADGKPESSEMHRILSGHPEKFALEKTEVADVVDLVASIFPPSKPNRGGFVRRSSMDGHYLSIKDASCFDRYFDFSMEGRIDQHDFDTLLARPLPDIQAQMEKWNEQTGQAIDLQVKLENHNQFATREEFEKVIRAVVYYSELPVARNPAYRNQYNADNFYLKLGGPLQGNEIVKKLYGGDPEPLRKFFKSLYPASTRLVEWRFVHEFLAELMAHYEDKFIVSHAEMKELVRDCMLKILQERNRIDGEVMGFYNQAIRVFADERDRQKIKPVGDGIVITDALKKVAVADFGTFLDFCVFRYNPIDNAYVTGDWQNIIFGSEANFEQELDKHKGDPKVDEFRTFYDQFKQGGNKPIIGFSFQHITPQ